MPIKTILFDINETVLDLRDLYPLFGRYFDDENLAKRWFLLLLHSSTVAAITDVKTTFAALAKTAAQKLASEYEIANEGDAIEAIAGKLADLPPHDDVIPALELLRANNFKTVAFSNSSLELVNNQITNAGLAPHFDKLISVESAACFKPHPKVYHFAASELGQPIDELCLIAAHDWDTHGALTAGLGAAYLNRSPHPYNEQFKKPPYIAATMPELAAQIIDDNKSD